MTSALFGFVFEIATDTSYVAAAKMKPERIRLFIKPYCGWCHEVMHWLDKRGIKYETLDVTSDAAARKEMYQLSGQSLAPVIDVDGETLADFGADELEEWWKDQGLNPT